MVNGYRSLVWTPSFLIGTGPGRFRVPADCEGYYGLMRQGGGNSDAAWANPFQIVRATIVIG